VVYTVITGCYKLAQYDTGLEINLKNL